MSRWQLPLKAGIVMALAAFVIGITAASALGWGSGGETEKPPASVPKHDQGKDNDEDEDEGKGGGKGGHEKPKPKPPETTPTPPAVQQVPPATTPPVTQAPPPVVSQGTTPPTPAQPTPLPTEQGAPESPVVAQAPPTAGAPTTPVANRRQLAKTGLDPALIALLGALCLGGGGLLFRRALART